MMVMALMTYYIAESLKASGVTALIVCAILQAQYAWYNLSPQGKHASGVTVGTMGFFAEAYIFTIIGLGLMQFSTTWWVPWFALFCFFICFFARFFSVLISHYVFVAFGSRKALNFKEVCYLAF